MPFAKDRGLVTCFLQEFGESLLRAVKGFRIGKLSIEVAVLPGKNNCPTGGTNRVGDKGTVEPHSLIGDTVQIGCFVPVRTIGGNCLISMIVRENEENIWSFAKGQRADQKEGQKEKEKKEDKALCFFFQSKRKILDT